MSLVVDVKVIVQQPTTVVTSIGLPGMRGVRGPQGIQGLVGTDLNYTHTQAVPASSWVIIHSLNKFPSVNIVDSAGSNVIGDIAYTNANSVTVTFNGSFSGIAYLN